MIQKPRRASAPKIDAWEAKDAANTIARAHEHLQNKPLMKAVKAHVEGLNKAVTGGLRPKPLTNRKPK